MAIEDTGASLQVDTLTQPVAVATDRVREVGSVVLGLLAVASTVALGSAFVLYAVLAITVLSPLVLVGIAVLAHRHDRALRAAGRAAGPSR